MQRGISEAHSADTTPPSQPPHPSPPCTLDPLRAKGIDALAPDPLHGILRIRLRHLELRWSTPLGMTTISEGDDLLATDPNLNPPPAAAAITAATLDFYVPECRQPVTTEIRPPFSVTIRASSAAARIWNWLAAAGFILSQATAILVLALAILSAATPDTDDNDDDAGDDSHHIHATRIT